MGRCIWLRIETLKTGPTQILSALETQLSLRSELLLQLESRRSVCSISGFKDEAWFMEKETGFCRINSDSRCNLCRDWIADSQLKTCWWWFSRFPYWNSRFGLWKRSSVRDSEKIELVCYGGSDGKGLPWRLLGGESQSEEAYSSSLWVEWYALNFCWLLLLNSTASASSTSTVVLL